METFLSCFAEQWALLIVVATLQNAAFLTLLLGALFCFRRADARFLRGIALLGLFKLFCPPLWSWEADAARSVVSAAVGEAAARAALSPLIVGAPERSNGVQTNLALWLFFAWAAGALATLGVAFAQERRAIALARGARRIGALPDGSTLEQTSASHSPFALGLFRKRVVVPGAWQTLAPECRAAALAHEAAHLRHKDQWINLARAVALAAHWFNPLAWIALARLNELTEMARDDEAIERSGLGAAEYAKRLLEVAESVCGSRSAHPVLATLTFSGAYRSLKERIAYHASDKKPVPGRSLIAALAVVALALSLSYCSSPSPLPSESGQSALAQKTAPQSPSRAATAAAEPGPYDFVEVDKEPFVDIRELKKNIAYPPEARAQGVQGKVYVRALVGADGVVKKCFAESVEGDVFVEPALKAVRAAVFFPASYKGQAVACWVSIPIIFWL